MRQLTCCVALDELLHAAQPVVHAQILVQMAAAAAQIQRQRELAINVLRRIPV